MRSRSIAQTVLPAVFALISTAALAAPNLLSNADFETVTLNGTAALNSYQLGRTDNTSFTGAQVTGWSNSGYSFFFKPNTADTTGAYQAQYNATTYLWGPGGGTGSANYSANGMPGASPVGGNFIGMDGDSNLRGTLSQKVTGLTVGATYNLSFYWAAAQQASYSGDTTQSWAVSWIDANNATTATYNTPTVNVISHGFSAWKQVTTSFVATTTAETISFMAMGSPNGTPPFALLDGVSLTAAPEPAAVAIFGVGLLALGFVYRQRKRA